MAAVIAVEKRGGARKGSGRKSNASQGLERRARMVSFKVTEAEYEAIVALAERAGEDVSTFVRAAVLFVGATVLTEGESK